MAVAVPYLIVGAVGLVGNWLLGPKSSAQNSTQPNAMPSVNQALRGTPLFINFGTVRVSAQITWTKNWTAVRQKGGGKGAAKGGGSGGGGSAKGSGSGASGYEYSWDLIYHFGMVDTPSFVTKAWVGSDLVKQSTVNGWNNGIGPSEFPSGADGQSDLVATETFFAEGFPTGSSNLAAWPYFTSQEGVSPAWPSTCWIGFNQLQLGTTPAVPQLSVELTPASANLTFEPTPKYLSTAAVTVSASPSMDGMMVGEDGLHYFFGPTDANSTYNLFCYETGAEAATFTATDWTDACAAVGFLGMTSGGGTGVPSTPNARVMVAGGTPYFFVGQVGTIVLTLIPLVICAALDTIRFKINSSGAIEIDGSFELGGSGENYVYATQLGSLIQTDPATDDQYMLSLQTSYSNADIAAVFCFPLQGSHPWDGDQTGWATGGPGDGALGWLNPWNSDTSFLGTDDYLIAALVDNGFGHAPDIITYVGANQMAFWAAHPGANSIWDGIVANGTLGVWYLRFDLSEVVPIMPSSAWFADALHTRTGGSASAPEAEYVTPFAFSTGDRLVLIVARGAGENNDNTLSPPGAAAHLIIATLDRTLGAVDTWTTTSIYDDWISMFDPVADAGVSSGNRDAAGAQFWDFTFDPASNTIYYRGQMSGGGLSSHSVLGTLGILTVAQDVTPPYVIRKILTSPVYGFNTAALFGFDISDDAIDDGTYADAVAKCVAEGIFISVSYTNQDSLLTVINDLLALYGGTLAEANGKIFFDVFRAGDVPVRTLDNDHLVVTEIGQPPVNVTKGALQDGFNSVQYQFFDRSIDYKQNQVTLNDEVDMDINGPRNKVYNSQFVMTGSLANLIAERALWSNMYGRDNYDFKLGWKDADLRPGNQITLVDSWHPSLSKGVKAVINKKIESERGVFDITATRVFDNHLTAQHGYTNIASVSGGIDDILQTTGPMLDFAAYELPQEFQGANGYVYFGYNQSTYIMGAQLFISRDAGANYILTQDVQPYIVSGRMAEPLPLRAPGFVETDIELYVLPKPGFTVSSPDFVTSYTFDDATPAIRQAGLSTLIVGSEAIAMQGLTLLGENHYRVSKLYRGWGGTPIAAVSSGAYWHEHAAGIFAFPVTEDDIGNKLYYKISGYNFAGRPYDVASIEAKNYTVRGLRWLPRCMPPVQLLVASGIAWDASSPFKGDKLAITSGGSDVTLTWRGAANNEGFGAGGFGNGAYGHFVDDGTTTGWRIDVRSTNGVGVSSFVASTRSFSYSAAQNSLDFGGFAQNVIYTVTPFNVKGDGPTSYSRSLSLIW